MLGSREADKSIAGSEKSGNAATNKKISSGVVESTDEPDNNARRLQADELDNSGKTNANSSTDTSTVPKETDSEDSLVLRNQHAEATVDQDANTEQRNERDNSGSTKLTPPEVSDIESNVPGLGLRLNLEQIAEAGEALVSLLDAERGRALPTTRTPKGEHIIQGNCLQRPTLALFCRVHTQH